MEAAETCDFCKAALAPRHRHLLDVAKRKILCSCDECAIIGTGGKEGYKQVPNRYIHLKYFQMPDSRWDAFMIPVGIAFFFFSSAVNRIAAFYPSPAGAIESEHGLEMWQDLVKRNPILSTLEPDVEALMVRRTTTGPHEYYLVPIDECYGLVGIMRSGWKGISGGHEVHNRIRKFFEELKAQSYAQHM